MANARFNAPKGYMICPKCFGDTEIDMTPRDAGGWPLGRCRRIACDHCEGDGLIRRDHPAPFGPNVGNPFLAPLEIPLLNAETLQPLSGPLYLEYLEQHERIEAVYGGKGGGKSLRREQIQQFAEQIDDAAKRAVAEPKRDSWGRKIDG